MKAAHYRLFRERAFATWQYVTTGLETVSGRTPTSLTLRKVRTLFQ